MASWQPKRTTVLPKPDLKGAVVHLEGDPASTGVISDLSGNSNDGTISGRLSTYNDGVDSIYQAHGAGGALITIPQSASINDKYNYTIIMDIKKNGNGEAGGGRIFDRAQIQFYATFFITNQSDGNAIWSVTTPLSRGLLTIKQNRNDPTTLPQMQFNGSDLSVAVHTAKTGTAVSDAGNDLILLNRVAGDRAADCNVRLFKFYPSQLSDDDLRDEYLRFAFPRVYRPTPRTEYAVTAAPVAAPNQVGPWMTWAGSHEWLDDGSERYLEHDSTAKNYFASIQSNQAYGFWYMKYRPGAGGAFVGIPWAIAQRGDALYSAASQTGYYLIHNADESLDLREMTGGATASLGSTAASWLPAGATDIELGIARRVTDGQITVYTRESNHTTWTQAIQATDNTVTSVKYLQNYTDVNGYSMQFRDILLWPYGDSLTPNDVPFLAD